MFFYAIYIATFPHKAFVEFIYGKLVGDKGYISKNLFQRLFVDGIQLITKLKNNMKGALMSVSDKLLLIVCFPRSRVSMYNVQLIHGFHCFEFIELTLFYILKSNSTVQQKETLAGYYLD